MGFVGGGPEKNYVRDGLPASKAELAELTDQLFRTAYELDDEYAFSVGQMVFNDVTLPRAEHFTRDMIERHLRSHDVRFLRDDDGDFRVDFDLQDSAAPVIVWLCATGPEDTLYRITSVAPQGPRPVTREEGLERCNEWNRGHFWPAAVVHDTTDGWDIITGAALQLRPGITQELFDEFTFGVIAGLLDFWGWLSAPPETAQPSGGSDSTTEG
jgi:hypothetical protein